MTTVIKGDNSNPSYINATGMPDSELANILPAIYKETARWAGAYNTPNRKLSMFDRQAYVAPDSIYSQFQVARTAVQNDDIVSGVCEVTSGLAFQGLSWESDDMDEADVFNQIATDLNLDNIIRNLYKEDFTFSQAVMGVWWDWKTYTVRGNNVTPAVPEKTVDPMTGEIIFKPAMNEKTGKPLKPKKVKKKKQFKVYCPTGITFLDPMKVIPLSPTMFGRDRLAWQSTPSEFAYFYKLLNGEVYDPIMSKFFLGPLDLSLPERMLVEQWGGDPYYLIELNPDFVFRVAPTRIAYERFADLRLKSVFPLLDLKQQLMEADRVALIGQANYILLIRIGDKDLPAQPGEIANARKGVENLAKIPVVVGDYRLQIDIIAPNQEFSLNESRYDTIDHRILHRCLGSVIGVDARNPDINSRSISRGLEGKRLMYRRVFEKQIAKAIVDHPKNKGLFDSEPNLAFTPRNVQVDADANIMQAVMSLRQSNDLSRETTLEFMGFDQDVEAMRRENEEENGYDEIFKTQVPFATPNTGAMVNGSPGATPLANGVNGGGRPLGGGKPANSPQSKLAPKTGTGNKSTKTAKNGGTA